MYHLFISVFHPLSLSELFKTLHGSGVIKGNVRDVSYVAVWGRLWNYNHSFDQKVDINLQ